MSEPAPATADAWQGIIQADPRVEALALSLLAAGGSWRRRHPRQKLPAALEKLRVLVGLGRQGRIGDPVLYTDQALATAENYLRSLVEGRER